MNAIPTSVLITQNPSLVSTEMRHFYYYSIRLPVSTYPVHALLLCAATSLLAVLKRLGLLWNLYDFIGIMSFNDCILFSQCVALQQLFYTVTLSTHTSRQYSLAGILYFIAFVFSSTDVGCIIIEIATSTYYGKQVLRRCVVTRRNKHGVPT